MKYIVAMIIARWPAGTDVTGQYTDEVRDRLISEGYIIAVEDERPEPEGQPEEVIDDAS